MGQSYGDLFAPWEISVAKSLVRDFQCRYPWLKLDFNDLLQECLIHWHKARIAFTAEKVPLPKAYVNKVIRNKLDNILEQQLAEKRKLEHFVRSLDQPTGEEMPLREVIADTEARLEDEVPLRVDVTKAVSELGPFQREVCKLLAQGYSIREVAARLGKSKSSIHREIGEIRRSFRDKGLDEYMS
ncbi:MAG: sigma-70 family RNA polymerase sigma factor [Deltaproteobacteria bacterium]|nr:sigma-70 family RNA polymerase sigma factor [Deltaproteobacteria bacterium]